MDTEPERQSLHKWLSQAVEGWEKTTDPASFSMSLRFSVRRGVAAEIKKRTCDAPDIDRAVAQQFISDIEKATEYTYDFVNSVKMHGTVEFLVASIGIPFAYGAAACFGRARSLIPSPAED